MPLRPFKAEDMLSLNLQAGQSHAGDPPPQLDDMRAMEGPTAVTYEEGGVPMCCAGAFELWGGRAYLWSYMSANVTPRGFWRLHKAAKEFVATLPWRRVEAAVECEFEEGHRWMLALGFKLECARARAFFLGRDHALYALVREGAA